VPARTLLGRLLKREASRLGEPATIAGRSAVSAPARIAVRAASSVAHRLRCGACPPRGRAAVASGQCGPDRSFRRHMDAPRRSRSGENVYLGRHSPAGCFGAPGRPELQYVLQFWRGGRGRELPERLGSAGAPECLRAKKFRPRAHQARRHCGGCRSARPRACVGGGGGSGPAITALRGAIGIAEADLLPEAISVERQAVPAEPAKSQGGRISLPPAAAAVGTAGGRTGVASGCAPGDASQPRRSRALCDLSIGGNGSTATDCPARV
jgi:hypothetical protein